ncbi:MAG: hypothetical protein C4332_16410, partial [Meiothermus sp.]
MTLILQMGHQIPRNLGAGQVDRLLARPIHVENQGFVGLLDTLYASGEPFFGSAIAFKTEAAAVAPARELYLDFIYQPMRN